MPFLPIFSQPSQKALSRGVVTMLLVYVGSIVALNIVLRYSPTEPDEDPSAIAAQMIPIFVYLASGFVAGFIARRSPLMHGALLGLIVASLFLAPPLIFTLIPQSWIRHPFVGYFEAFSWLAFLQLAIGAIFICSLGAVFGDYVSNRRKAP